MSNVFASIRQFFAELRRRNVYKVAAAYAVVGWILIQAANVILPRLRLPDWTVTLVIVLVAFGFPIALVLAWAFELTPEGMRQTSTKDLSSEATQPEAPARARSGLGLWLGAALLAVGLVGGWWALSESGDGASSPSPPSDITERSIAVLPFAPLSSGEESQTFARGIHDDLLTRLANISELKVISRTAVQQYRDTELTTGQIADSLGVRWVMEGGVQVLGDQIQVNAQLIDPRSEIHAWADDYQRDLTAEDLFAIQGEITGEIAEALQAQLTAGEQRRIAGAPTQNLDAYRLYVRGRRLMASRRPDSLRRARRSFQQALRQDSSFAIAWSGLADARMLYASYSSASAEAREDTIRAAIPEARAAARRALELEPNLAEAHASLAIISMYEQLVRPGQANIPAAFRHLQRTVELKPSYAQAHHWLGELQLHLGRAAPALEHLRLAVELSPDNFSARLSLTVTLIANRKYKAALAEAKRLQSMYPEREAGGALQGLALLHLKRWDEVRERRAQSGPPGWTTVFPALADIEAGDTAAAQNRIEELHAEEEDFWAALAHAALGDVDAAFRTLPEIEMTDAPLWYMVTLRYYFPDLLARFRADPRYEALIEEINQQWGLNPDGSIPEDSDAPLSADPEADA